MTCVCGGTIDRTSPRWLICDDCGACYVADPTPKDRAADLATEEALLYGHGRDRMREMARNDADRRRFRDTNPGMEAGT